MSVFECCLMTISAGPIHKRKTKLFLEKKGKTGHRPCRLLALLQHRLETERRPNPKRTAHQFVTRYCCWRLFGRRRKRPKASVDPEMLLQQLRRPSTCHSATRVSFFSNKAMEMRKAWWPHRKEDLKTIKHRQVYSNRSS